ncbi:hypothetical protein GCM10025859_66220 [Alicyclobacillus fastidiosus]|nr:hypothetical protein GCM10025859_64020 [Alicyclobacillus fastidiosus]GMA66180.1 hypothetical protein GCM10025859_66220 [Alicyclobacillus fastidiosus]
MKRQSETSVDVLPFFDVAGKMSDDKKNIFNISLKNLGKGPAFHIRGTISDTQTREDLTQSAKPFISVLSAEDENLMAYGIAA